MLFSKTIVVFFFLCCVNLCLSKPTTGNKLTEGRGVMSSVWGWITYPLSWWSGLGETEQPMTEQLVESTTNNRNDILHISSHNVTIWCNDQTCTTMKCDKTQCRNITCNIYDTNLRGECKKYNIITDPEENTVPNSTETPIKVNIQSKPTESSNTTSGVLNNFHDHNNQTFEELKINNITTGNDEHTVPKSIQSKPIENPTTISVAIREKDNRTTIEQTVEKHSESKEDPTILSTKV